MISNFDVPSESLRRILGGIRDVPRLDETEERELARRAGEGDEEAAAELVASQLRHLAQLARRFAHKGLPLEDLIHEGALGLLLAARRYDPRHGARFFTYGAFFARRAMVAAIARSSKTIRVPRHAAARIRRVRAAEQELAARGEAATPEALAPLLGVSASQAGELAALRSPFEVSIDEPLDASPAGRTRGDSLADSRLPAPDARLEASERRRELLRALAELPERERAILEARHGLHGGKSRTLRELGIDLSLSKERVRQLEERAKALVRDRLSQRFAASPAPPPA